MIAGGILAAVAVFQLGAVTVAFFKKGRVPAENAEEPVHAPPMKIDVSKLVAEAPPPEDPMPLGNVDPLVNGTEERLPGPKPILPHAEPLKPPVEEGTGLAQASPTPPPRPTPVPLSAFTPKTDARYLDVIEQGKLLRGSGDTAGALVKLREAERLEPANPLAIAEQAFTFEKMSLPDKAAEQWKRIFVMGERAGLYFSMAKSKLESAVQDTMRSTGGAPAGTGAAEIPKGKMLAIGSTEMSEERDSSSAKRFSLAVPVRARMSEPVAVREMKVFVLFYDRANGKDITRTVANVSNHWTSQPVDWRDGDTEVLEVSYDLPVAQAQNERREYYGYIVRLYYRGELQDTKAEPASLNQKFPAPFNLSE